MLRYNRILWKSGASLLDKSLELSDILSDALTFNFVNATDYMYIASDLPFNHRYFDVGVVNALAASLTVQLWDGTSWKDAIDVIDETSVGGVPFAKSGIISWGQDPDTTLWGYDDTDEMTGSGVETGPKIIGLYWARLKWSADLTGTMTLKYVGHRFSNDSDLEAEYPDLSRSALKNAFKTGKTDWNDQIVIASEYLVEDLRGGKNLIRNANQLLDWRLFKHASVHKTAEIIFRAFGQDYEQNLKDAIIAYKKSLSVGKFNIDQDRDLQLSEIEKDTNVTYMSR